jgi:hypothetical protein
VSCRSSTGTTRRALSLADLVGPTDLTPTPGHSCRVTSSDASTLPLGKAARWSMYDTTPHARHDTTHTTHDTSRNTALLYGLSSELTHRFVLAGRFATGHQAVLGRGAAKHARQESARCAPLWTRRQRGQGRLARHRLQGTLASPPHQRTRADLTVDSALWCPLHSSAP